MVVAILSAVAAAFTLAVAIRDRSLVSAMGCVLMLATLAVALLR